MFNQDTWSFNSFFLQCITNFFKGLGGEKLVLCHFNDHKWFLSVQFCNGRIPVSKSIDQFSFRKFIYGTKIRITGKTGMTKVINMWSITSNARDGSWTSFKCVTAVLMFLFCPVHDYVFFWYQHNTLYAWKYMKKFLGTLMTQLFRPKRKWKLSPLIDHDTQDCNNINSICNIPWQCFPNSGPWTTASPRLSSCWSAYSSQVFLTSYFLFSLVFKSINYFTNLNFRFVWNLVFC
jgi:hypothetical protein